MKRFINKVFTSLPHSGFHWEMFTGALGTQIEIIRADHNDTANVKKGIKDADIAVLAGDISKEVLNSALNLKWVHCDHSGVNNSAHPEIFQRGILLTSSAGRSAAVLAEHIFFLMLSLVYDSRLLEKQQRDHIWNNLYKDRRGLFSKTIGIIGMGHTGKALAARAKAFGMTVLGYGRYECLSPAGTHPCADRMWFADNADAIDGLLKESDIVVLTVRLSDQTYHMIDERALKLMKPSSYLINMARGAVVDENALYNALVNKTIAMAASDVFTEEPLSKDSPLWDLPNFVITPHCTPEVPDLALSGLNIICENIWRYREGEELLNCLTVRDVYTKNR